MQSKTELALCARLCFDWCRRCFGDKIALSPQERTLRIIKEAVELAQVHQVPKDLCHRLIDNIYNRPIGHAFQEVGGIFITLLVYCEQQGMDPELALQSELIRILAKDPEAFRARMAQKEREGVSA